ncbi:pyrroloquinoline quinone biosynthesis protein PqqF [Pseudomonas sp. SIMBA_077]
MSAPNDLNTQRLTLENGLTLSLRHEPRLNQCAAFLRVHVGSHDVPTAWPGLAHFLEHLLFLGTERFPATDNLMAYVQRHGGQVNARTQARHTDFFFEVPNAAFEGGLERLCDMLAHPRMNRDEQMREREVLHAEFIAWAREPSAQRQLGLFQPLNPAHPLRAFHAGNRFSLPIPRPAFQQALADFYQPSYQAANISLSLVGPLPAPTLKALAERYTDQLAKGSPPRQSSPRALMLNHQSVYQQLDAQHLDLLFALEQLPQACSAALDYVCHWLNADKPGSLLAYLREHQLCNTLKAEVLYHYSGQALLHIEFSATQHIAHHATQISDAFYDWLTFFSAHQQHPDLRNAFMLQRQRQQEVCSALALARSELERSDQSLEALTCVLQQMLPAAPPALQHTWQLPAPNPFLVTPKEPTHAGLIRGQTSAHRGLRTFAQDRLRSHRNHSAMRVSADLPEAGHEAAVYLRWRLPAAPNADVQLTLANSLRPLQADARHAGVELSGSPCGNDWLLKMQGFHAPMPAILEHALRALSSLEAEQDVSVVAPLMPIRQLLKRLPECSQSGLEPTLSDASQCWVGARWDGLAVGLPSATAPLISAALNKAPGTPDAHLPRAEYSAQRRWITQACDSSEQAVLLFCPAPTGDLGAEAAWRLLAHVAQTPFYQQLRVERQLGYAVFSGLRQLNGQTGLLFGVQSPHASGAEIFEHIRAFLVELPTLIAALDETTFMQARDALAQQVLPAALSGPQASEWLWQARLAGHSSGYFEALYAELIRLDLRTTLEAAQQINRPECAWLCLATQPATESFLFGQS